MIEMPEATRHRVLNCLTSINLYYRLSVKKISGEILWMSVCSIDFKVRFNRFSFQSISNKQCAWFARLSIHPHEYVWWLIVNEIQAYGVIWWRYSDTSSSYTVLFHNSLLNSCSLCWSFRCYIQRWPRSAVSVRSMIAAISMCITLF